jgi:hypothetical protein
MADQPNVLQPGNNYDETGKVKVTEGQPEGHSFPGEMIPSSNNRDCNTEHGSGWGKATASYPYIWFGNMSEKEWQKQNALYPGACIPWRHSTAQIDGLQINQPGITGPGNINITGNIIAAAVNAGTHSLATKKDFDIPHPTKEGHRLRHVCLEGPEAGVYIRGRLTDNNVIELPEYWRGLVDPETITVTLTQIRTTQDLIVDGIEWGTRVKIKSGNASKIDCFYVIHAERSDGEKLIAEYKGNSIEDYPGDNTQYTHNR